ncbi:MAG: PIN domain-containing protein [Solirubrobacteraceae bacterium]
MTADSSALIAAFGGWHRRHGPALDALAEVADLATHAELEAYSVLTRLPKPHRAPAELAAEYLSGGYPGRRLVLPAARRNGFVTRLADRGISGGMVYDALIAATAAEHGLRLLTCDKRAERTYERLGVAYELI